MTMFVSFIGGRESSSTSHYLRNNIMLIQYYAEFHGFEFGGGFDYDDDIMSKEKVKYVCIG